MFAFDLPFLFICGFLLRYLTTIGRITENLNWLLGIILCFLFQVGGLMLWFNILPNSQDFMIIPFNILGLSVNDFEPFIAPVLFGLEPILLVLGEKINIK